jgi:hypothetical protein
MTTRADGTGVCDRCGVDLPNTGVGYCVAITGMTSDGYSWYGHLCTSSKPAESGPNWPSCAQAVMDEQSLAHLVSSGGAVPQFFDQNAPIPEPPDEPSPPDDGDILVPPGEPADNG